MNAGLWTLIAAVVTGGGVLARHEPSRRLFFGAFRQERAHQHSHHVRRTVADVSQRTHEPV